MSFGRDTEPGEIDLSCPINWDHPDNTGLALCLSAVDGTAGGAKFLDLCRLGDRTAGGTLVNGPTWVGTPWGQWGMGFTAASSQRTHCTIPLIGTGDFRASFWCYPTASGPVFFGTNSGTGNVWVGTAISGLQLSIDGSLISSSAAASLNTWTFIGIGRSSGTAYIYVNGKQTGSGSMPAAILLTAAALGSFGQGGTFPFSGRLTGFRFFAGVAPSAAWADRDYQWSRDPATDPRLNRITGRTYFLPPYTATTRKTGYAPWIPGLGW